MHVDMHTQYEAVCVCVCIMWLRGLVSGYNLFVQTVVDATLLKKVKTSIERNKSLQMLGIYIGHSGVVEAILKGARGNTSLKQLNMQLLSIPDMSHLKTAVAELHQVRPQLEVNVL